MASSEETGKITATYNLLRLNHEEIESLIIPITRRLN